MLGPMSEALQLHRATLDNGMRVVVNPDTTSPGVAVNMWYRVGSADEEPGHFGFAHLFEHLMFSGTTSGIASSEHLATIESVGGSANASTSFDRTNYFETVPAGALELALWLEAERLAHLAVTEANLATQREVVKEEKRQRYDNTPMGTYSICSLTEGSAASILRSSNHRFGPRPRRRLSRRRHRLSFHLVPARQCRSCHFRVC